ncbi:hypothetical protein MtrunA17_Chr5g0426351 [Medicago truncatula]|uniref:Transmembrane protein n=1 Tax=Medicago truncatula TaxID=3880 RepID=A0A396HUD6_MEDTR|nr:hypothetical protein MtrunA17_Chr5g0426351 [Medicago truncatula]
MIIYSRIGQEIMVIVDEIKVVPWKWNLARLKGSPCLFYEWCWDRGKCVKRQKVKVFSMFCFHVAATVCASTDGCFLFSFPLRFAEPAAVCGEVFSCFSVFCFSRGMLLLLFSCCKLGAICFGSYPCLFYGFFQGCSTYRRCFCFVSSASLCASCVVLVSNKFSPFRKEKNTVTNTI